MASARIDDAPPGYLSVSDAEALISAKVNAAVQAMAVMMAKADPVSAEPTPSNELWARQLALAISEVSNTGPKKLSAEEQTAREAAHIEMVALINNYAARNIDPEYRLKRKVVLDDPRMGPFLIEPLWQDPATKKQMHTTVTWPGVPNAAMEPMNDAAKEIFELFKKSVGGIRDIRERQRLTAKGVVIVEGQMPTVQEKLQGGADPTISRGVKITGRGTPGEVIQTNILGTVAAPARQTSGRAAA